ncbi:tetratricopeptide repeat protein [Nocardioides sp. cx-169]|uniref:tetratricopeptide repeat protein n=1 Tax=Nocardioides sp. cx-169 TaxID=2899080 RepID=UPI001E3DD624|nr:tetratricopeptide repeat protein [Nocardioides sp. cx-169]MCD4535296.1 tetratricopeptide repeat protein [Nocardioides sp. cx-169]
MTTTPWEHLFVQALGASEAGDAEQAYRTFLSVLALDDVPAYARSLASTNIATMHLRSQRVDEAMEWYERAVQLDPDGESAAVALGAMGISLERLERRQEAIETFERLLALPTLPEASRLTAEENLRALRGE